jgi:hypothetical protein
MRDSQLSGRIFLDGNRVAGALVTLYEPKNRRKVGSTVVDSDGNFLLANLRPGIYLLRVRLAGYAVLIVEGVEIKRGFRSSAESFRLAPCHQSAACPAVKWVSQALCL